MKFKNFRRAHIITIKRYKKLIEFLTKENKDPEKIYVELFQLNWLKLLKWTLTEFNYLNKLT